MIAFSLIPAGCAWGMEQQSQGSGSLRSPEELKKEIYQLQNGFLWHRPASQIPEIAQWLNAATYARKQVNDPGLLQQILADGQERHKGIQKAVTPLPPALAKCAQKYMASIEKLADE